MVIRFDNKMIQDAVARRVEPIGVEGDPSTQAGGITEAEAIVSAVKKQMPNAGNADVASVTREINRDQEGAQGQQEPGPELDAGILERARQKAASGKQAAGVDPGSR